MADKRISVVFDASLNASQMSSAVKKIQSEFEKINLSGAVQKEFNSMLTKLDEAVKDFSTKAARKEITSSKDMNELERSFDQVMRLYKQIQTEAKSLGGLTGEGLLKILPKNFGQEFDQAKQYLNDYKKAVEKNEREIKNTKEDLNKANKKVQTQRDKKQALESKKIMEAYQKEELVQQRKQTKKDIQDYKKQIQEKRTALENFEKEHQNKITKSGKINKSFKDSEALQQEYDKLKAELSQKEAEVGPSLQKAIELYNKLDSQIKGGISQSEFDINLDKITKDLQAAEKEASEFATKLQNLESGPIDSEKFEQLRKEVEKISGLDLSNLNPDTGGLKELEQIFTKLQAGKLQEAKEQIENLIKAANGLGDSVENTDKIVGGIKTMTSEADRAAQEMERLKDQVLDFFSIGNTVQIFKNAIRDAFDTVKELDAVMTETAVVTDFSIGDMWNKLPEYADKASAMGASIKDLYSATTLYYQQGLNTDEAMGLGVETMKMARVANMEATAATEAMTAALRGFNMEINSMNAERINDVYSELAAVTAADTSQIATAMSKTASIASSANMEFETTAAFLSQIIETTQEAPETAGTAMKTIIARFTEVKQLFDEGMLSGKDAEGEEININKIDAALKTVGISLKDFLTGAKGIDDIFLELASKWDSLDLATQRYIATTAAGSRQQSRFIAMMSNYDRTMELVNAANNSAGASQEQFNKTLDSLDAKLQRLQNAWAEFTMGLANNQAIKAGVDFLTMLLETINKLTGSTGNEGFGGLITSFSKLLVLIGALKVGGNIFQGIFGGLGAEGGIKIAEKILPTLTAFKEVDSAGKMLKVTLNGLKGGWDGLLGSLTKTKTFWSNTAMDIMAVGEGMGILGQQAYAAGNYLALFGLGFAKITAIIMVVVIAITALVQIFKAIKASTPEGKLEAAKIATQEAGEAAEAAAESYNNLKSALDSLAGKESNLANLTRGTQEWRDAVQELNADVLSLVNNYPELGAFLENSGGVLTINTEKEVGGKTVDSILKESSINVFKTQAIEAIRKADEIKAQKEVGQKDFQKILDFENYGSEKSVTSAEILAELIKAYDSGELSQIRSNTTSDIFAIEDWLYQKGYGGYSVVSSEDFTLKDLETYAQTQARQDKEVNTQYLSAAQSALNMADLSITGEKALTNLDSDILSKGYEQIYNDILETQKLTFSDLQLFALQNSGAGYSYKDGKLYLNDTALTAEQTKQHIATVKATEQYAENLEKLSSGINNDFLKSLITEDGKDISKESLEKYTNYSRDKGTYEFDQSKIFELSREAGFESIKDMADSFGISITDLINTLSENFESAGDRLVKTRKSVVANMSKYGPEGLEGEQRYEYNAGKLALMEELVGESYLSTLDNLFTSLEKTGDSDLISGALESFNKLGVTKENVAEIDKFISDIDWTNPIEAAKAISTEMENGTGATKQFAQAVRDSGSSFLSAESQVKHFVKSADYKEVKASLLEILETNEEISATDISDLTDEFSSLNSLLKNTKMSASSAAKMLQKLAQGKLSIDQLSGAVIAAISQFNSLEGLSLSITDKMSKLDLGVDENQVTETLSGWAETLKSNLQKGAYGNTQNFKILDFLFGEQWREGLSGQELQKEMERLAIMLEQNGKTMWHSWDDLAKGRDFKGKQFNKDLLDGLSITDNGRGGFNLTGYEEKTTAQIVDIVKNAYGVSKEYAEMMVTDFKNNSVDMATILGENDYVAAIKAAKDQMTKTGDEFIDLSEIKAIADFYNQSIEDTIDKFDGVTITDFWDDEGKIKETEDLITELNNIQPDFASQFKKDGLLNVTELQKALEDLEIPESAQTDIINQLAGIGETATEIYARTSDGVMSKIIVGANQTVDEAIAKYEQSLKNESLANAIVSGFSKIADALNGSAIAEFFNSSQELKFIISPSSIALAKSQLDAFEEEPKTITLLGENSDLYAKVGELEGYSITVTFNGEWGCVPSFSGNTSDTSGKTSDYTPQAVGVKNAPSSYDALVSEEGPELIQTKDGAYLTGQNGPELAHINKGDTIYTAEETAQILKGRNHKTIPRFNKGISGYGGGMSSGGGGGAGEDDESWENSFDKLYNLVRQIEEEQRQRDRIERRYEELLESIATSARGLIDVSREQLQQLEYERQLQQDLIAGRLEQITELQEKEGLTEYAWTETNAYGEKILRVNWELIDAIKDSEKGDEVSDYISKLEEWVDSVNEAENTLRDIEDEVKDIKQRGEDEYFDLEEKIKDAVVKAREEEIEKLNTINDTINDSTSNILNSLQKTLDRQRQARENQETEEELSDLRRQLAYLQQDTSGASDSKILELQKQIKEGTTDYTDQLIDQKISELQDQNEKASEQRQWQIELAQAQLDQYINSGEIWNEVYKLMEEGLNEENGLVRGSQLDKLLKNGEGYESLSKIGQMAWLEELTDLIAQSLGYLELGRQLEDLKGAEGIPGAGQSIVFYKDGKYYQGTVDEKGNVTTADGKKFNNVYQGYNGRFYAGKNYAENEIRLNSNGDIVEPKKKPISNNGGGSGGGGYYGGSGNTTTSNPQEQIDKNNQEIAKNNNERNKLNNERLQELADIQASNLSNIDKQDLTNAVNSQYSHKINDLINQNNNLQSQNSELLAQQLIKKYKTGGLANFTGPAWLDGTKSKPEYVLNSAQTKSFLTLVDVLSGLKEGTFKTDTQISKGDTFDIDINIESVREEVDIDMVAEKVQKSVVAASKYRNNIFTKR